MRKLSVARRGTHLADKLSTINATSDKLTSSSGESERHPSGASDALPAVEVGGDLTVLGRTFQLGASSGEETSTQPRISVSPPHPLLYPSGRDHLGMLASITLRSSMGQSVCLMVTKSSFGMKISRISYSLRASFSSCTASPTEPYQRWKHTAFSTA